MGRMNRVRKQDAEKLVFAQVAQKGPDHPSAGWVQARGVLSSYVAAPRERATVVDWPFSATCQEVGTMAKGYGRQGLTTLDEVVLAQALELEALLNVLERKGILSKAEVLEEMKRLRESPPKAK
jgi:hypothetical protein